jgi:hypothetical protein
MSVWMNKCGALMEWYWQEKVELLGRKPIPGIENFLPGKMQATNRSSHTAGPLFHCVLSCVCVLIQWEIWVPGRNRMCPMYPYVPLCTRTLFRPITAAYYWTNSIWRLCVSPKHRNKQVQKRPLEQQLPWEPRTCDMLVSRNSNMAQNFLTFPGLTNDYKNYNHLFLCI